MIEPKTLEECKRQLIDNQRLSEANTKSLEAALTNISFLYQAILALTEQHDKDVLYQIFLKKVGQMLGAEISLVYGLNHDDKEYFVLASLGTKHSERLKIAGPWQGSFIDEALASGKIIRASDTKPLSGKLPSLLESYQIYASLSAPIETSAGIEAVAQFNRLRPEAFSVDDERMLLILLDRLNAIVANINIQEDLKAKTEELIKMNNLMIDRELKMIELKKEIEELRR